MLKLALLFFLISMIAGFFGFTDTAVRTKNIAKILFFISILIFLAVFIFGVLLGVWIF
ncbi:MAG: DUF1328 domain-containing protein [Gammaproteobacteria bacterium]|nr:DUF1328 domain-containing protein [Gammaproteobacteria bacterium]